MSCHIGFANGSPSPRLAIPFLNGVSLDEQMFLYFEEI